MKDTSTKKKGFSGRGFVSVMTAFSFIALTISGLVGAITPPGRFAHWTGWRFLGLLKDQWGALHVWFALIFLTACTFHIYLNWKPLMNYFKSRVSHRFTLRKEWGLALVIGIVVFVGTLAEVMPFSTLIAWEEDIKHSWETASQAAPIPHAELLTLAELATETGTQVEEMIINLHNKGINDAMAETVVQDLADVHKITPREIFQLALGKEVPTRQETMGGGGRGQGFGQRGGGQGGGRGGGGFGQGGGHGGGGFGQGGRLGRLSLKEICVQENLELEKALENLKEAGIEAKAEMTVKEIVEEDDVGPFELMGIMKKK